MYWLFTSRAQNYVVAFFYMKRYQLFTTENRMWLCTLDSLLVWLTLWRNLRKLPEIYSTYYFLNAVIYLTTKFKFVRIFSPANWIGIKKIAATQLGRLAIFIDVWLYRERLIDGKFDSHFVTTRINWSTKSL